MAYYFYLGNVLLPVPPKKLDMKIDNKNKTYDLINNSQINILKSPGLTSIEFEILLPNSKYLREGRALPDFNSNLLFAMKNRLAMLCYI